MLRAQGRRAAMFTRNIRLAVTVGLRIAIILLALPINAHAGFEDNYGSWAQLSSEQKNAYLMGMFDYVSNTASDETDVALAHGLQSCAKQINLKSQMLVETVDDYYKNNKDKWGKSVTHVFMNSVITSVCKSYIDGERKKVGLEPLP